jgi:hypothetical protein
MRLCERWLQDAEFVKRAAIRMVTKSYAKPLINRRVLNMVWEWLLDQVIDSQIIRDHRSAAFIASHGK